MGRRQRTHVLQTCTAAYTTWRNDWAFLFAQYFQPSNLTAITKCIGMHYRQDILWGKFIAAQSPLPLLFSLLSPAGADPGFWFWGHFVGRNNRGYAGAESMGGLEYPPTSGEGSRVWGGGRGTTLENDLILLSRNSYFGAFSSHL